MTREQVIGVDGHLPWHCAEELQLFRTLTLGNTVVMGRRTFASLGRPLAGRRNLVVSTTLAPQPGIELCTSFDEAVAQALATPELVYYIGGAQLYSAALRRVGSLRISWMKQNYAGTLYFPTIDFADWELVGETDYAEFVHCEYRRRVALLNR